LDDKGEEDERHHVLVNKKTGKVASTNHWLLALAACALVNDDTSGIAGLLPQEQAKKILVSNRLSTKVARRAKDGRLTDNISNQAVDFLPQLAVLFGEQHPQHKTVTRKNFCSWIVKQLADESSIAMRIAIDHGYEDLIFNTSGDRPRSVRWWMDQVKKMQS